MKKTINCEEVKEFSNLEEGRWKIGHFTFTKRAKCIGQNGRIFDGFLFKTGNTYSAISVKKLINFLNITL